jgi:hypothetical protein
LTVKVDFGRILPGLVVFLLGAGLFVLWVLLAFFSFFLFFVPELHWVFYFALDVLVASLVLMGSGVLIMISGASGWREMAGENVSLSGRVNRRVERDRMRIGERFGEVVGVFVSLLILLFFWENQVRGTGFFTSAFRLPEQFLFYGPAVFGVLVSLARAVYGRRNAIRPLEILQAAFLVTAAFWLYSVFPFDFAHFTDLLPGAIRPAFFWATDAVASIVLLLAGIGSLANLVYTSVLFATMRAQLARGLQGTTGDGRR